MNERLPNDAFDFYVSLGERRSYAAVAERFVVDKKTVVRRAKKEDWQNRLDAITQQARKTTDQKIVESIEQMNERHLATLRVIQGKALNTLRAMPLEDAMDAVRALEIAIRGERLVRGEPTDRSAIDVEDMIRREHVRWMRPQESDGPRDDLDDERRGEMFGETPEGMLEGTPDAASEDDDGDPK